jgi:hypothetical protein
MSAGIAEDRGESRDLQQAKKIAECRLAGVDLT